MPLRKTPPEERAKQVDYLEGLMEGFVAYDGDWVMTYMNAAAERLLGRTRADVLGKTWHAAFPHAVGNEVDHMYQRVKASRKPERMELYYPHYDRWMEISASPISDGGLGVYFSDISARKRAEDALQAANAQLLEGARRKDEFLATLAHELRNPLAPISNAIQILNVISSQEEAPRSLRGMVSRQLALMSRLIEDLLDVSRITSGKLELRRQPVELARVAEQALETARPNLRGHEFTVSLPAEPLWLDADPVRLSQVFANLLNNACKFTPEGGKVRLTAKREGGSAVVSVIDNGVGIAPEHLPRLFEMFAQLGAGAPQGQGGLGIGLALSRGLVEMHGGTISAASAGPGGGSVFTVTLPVREAPQAAERARAALPPPAPRRILVVDDNVDGAQSLAMLLAADGHEVQVANDGERALAAAAAFSPDTVLLDIGLPGMSGLEVCRALRARPGGDRIQIAALTGWGQDADLRRTRDAGFDAHLVKPVEHERLIELLSAQRVVI
jgi:PAS domain S-box-containing protein